MGTYSAKLIILRGNSASGKSTVAKQVREASHRKIAIVEQDYLRRFILREKEDVSEDNIELIRRTVTYALSRDYDVILEGILYFPRYGSMLKRLIKQTPNNFVYYFDVSFEETLRRHATKPKADVYGAKEMEEWYKPRQLTGFANEKIIPEGYSVKQAVSMILKDAGL